MSHNKRVLFLGFIFTALSVFGAAEAAPELLVGTVSGAPGEQATIPVNYTSDGAVAALQFEIQYDPSQLTAADPLPSPAIAGIYTVHSSEPSAGLRRIIIVPPETNPVISSGLLLDIPVTINPTASYQSESLAITAVVMSGSSATAVTPTAVTNGSINIEPSNPVTISTVTLSDGITGQPYSQTLAATDGASPYSWSITSGALPIGLTLNTSTGEISGAPTAAGTTNFTVQVTDSITVTDSQSLSITIVDPLIIGTTALPGGITSSAYSQTLSANGGTAPYSWSLISGSLPTGLTLNTSTGEISGVPTAAGSINFTVQVEDSLNVTATQALTIDIVDSLIIETNTLSDGIIGSAYSQTLSVSGGIAPYSWSLSVGTLPAGLTLNASTGEISGTPTTADTTDFTVQVQDSLTVTVTQVLTINIVDPVIPETGKLIAWTDRVGVAVDGGTLTKTAAYGWGNSGAASVQTIPGDGAVEFTATETNANLIFGLSNSNEDAHDHTIDYAILARSNDAVAVYENGVGRGNFGTYQSGDILRVERVGNAVVYKQNGTILYTSTIPSTGELIADTALKMTGSEITNARIYGVATIASDTDGDGLPDAWETANGLNPANSDDASQDLDGDNLSNLEEYQQGTDPAVVDGMMVPTISPDGGTFDSATSVSLTPGTGTVGATLYYTLDGSTPTTSSAVYSDPFMLAENTTVKVIAVLSGYIDSAVTSASFTITTTSTPIAWTDRVGVSVDGGTLTKTAASGWGNSGAASVQTIPGDGAVEFMVMASNTKLILGLSNSNEDARDRTIDYAILARDYGTVAVYENGVGRGDFGTYQSGDILRVERVGSTIVYKQNGTVLYTSTIPSTGELIADAAINLTGAKVANARIDGVAVVASDTDGDGLPDAWETANGLDPANGDDASQDLDGDNLSNLEEYQRGTDPAVMDAMMAPTISPDGGTFESATSVSLTPGTGTVGATLYYTLDGSTPTTSSAVYSDSFMLTESATVKAIAVLDGYIDSAVTSASFTITVN